MRPPGLALRHLLPLDRQLGLARLPALVLVLAQVSELLPELVRQTPPVVVRSHKLERHPGSDLQPVWAHLRRLARAHLPALELHQALEPRLLYRLVRRLALVPGQAPARGLSSKPQQLPASAPLLQLGQEQRRL